jgi:hypothetical protein
VVKARTAYRAACSRQAQTEWELPPSFDITAYSTTASEARAHTKQGAEPSDAKQWWSPHDQRPIVGLASDAKKPFYLEPCKSRTATIGRRQTWYCSSGRQNFDRSRAMLAMEHLCI